MQRWQQIEVVGVDGAPKMLAVAKARGQSLGSDQARRLHWQQACLPDPTLPVGFTAVSATACCTTCMSHRCCGNPSSKWPLQAAVVVIHDLRRPTSEEELQQLVERHADTAPPVLKRDYEASLRAAFSAEEVQQQLLEAQRPQLKVMEREDRYLTVWGNWLDAAEFCPFAGDLQPLAQPMPQHI